MRTCVDPTDPNRFALVVEGTTLQDFDDILRSEDAVKAMKHDGVHPDPVRRTLPPQDASFGALPTTDQPR